MPTVFKPNDVYQVMRNLAMQATGRKDIEVVDHRGFINAGNTALEVGVDALTEAIFVTINDVFVMSRPYKAQFATIIDSYDTPFSDYHARMHFYTKYNEPTGSWNTNIFNNHKDGYDNGTNGGDSADDMWTQNVMMPLERFYRASATNQIRMTIYETELQAAFTNESTFLAFMNGHAITVQNEIEKYREELLRALIVDRCAGIKRLVDEGILGPECLVDVTELFQEETGELYSWEEIKTKHLTEFLEILMSKFAIDSDRLTELSCLYHDPVKKTVDGEDYWILEHTPKADQRFFYSKEIFQKARSRVLPQLFNPQFIPENQGEGITFWQSNLEGYRYSIDCIPPTPAEYNLAPKEVKIDTVIALNFDRNALTHSQQFERVADSPLEAAKLYRNRIWHKKEGAYSDYLSNSILYYASEYGKAKKSMSFVGDGSETEFTLEDGAYKILSVTVAGEATDAYTFDQETATITFTTAPADEAAIDIEYVIR